MRKEPAQNIIERLVESRIASEIKAVIDGGAASVHAAPPLCPVIASLVYKLYGGPLVVVVPSAAGDFADDAGCFLPGEVFHLPGKGPSGDLFRPNDEVVGTRTKAAQAFAGCKLLVAGIEAAAEGLPVLPEKPWPMSVEPGAGIDLDRLLELLVEGGYKREYLVEGWGRFALRGGVLDVFPSTGRRPVRIEFVGDTVESIREFNVVTQRSMEEIPGLEIFPAIELAPAVDRKKRKLDCRVIAVDPGGLQAKAGELYPEMEADGGARKIMDGWGRVLEVETLETAAGELYQFPGRAAMEFFGKVDAAVAGIVSLQKDEYDISVMLEGEGQVKRFGEIWDEQGEGGVMPHLGVGSLRKGFVIPEMKLALFTAAELLGRRKKIKRPKRLSSAEPVADYAELEVGGYAVHVDQGIGIFRGLTSRTVLGVSREYLLLEYAGGDRLYVPISQLDRVQRYIGVENPAVNKLRSKAWGRSKRSAKRSAEETARKLFQLYLERKSGKGFHFSKDTTWQVEMEDSFQYEDTPDQARASLEVKSDMESEKAMDRLICGDVGYGKTEVAVRASMKAVMDSKQVAVLVPTTVLARQHYETFRERMAPFPVKIEMLSRFLSPIEQRRVTSDLNAGKVDIVIGTHRLFKSDVLFNDLGLLVIDEEQKFGVAHKEKLKRLKKSVDTLAMTATPIPRTLQMSLSGIRDISMIDTAPEDRHPVSTYIGEFDIEVVRAAINYETMRSGQVFYVHNRVETIERAAEKIRDILPDLSVAVAHGRMSEDDLEQVMLEFADGLHSVLVCTTIIESGLDLPNVNTLIVEGAERLGLAQLYQIRGRVGRAGRRAYAYMFYPSRRVLTDTAVARLATIGEMTELGSGMRIAMRDLEIRGAGNLLGEKQSGHIEAVGFELYCQMLRSAVEALKGEMAEPMSESVVELPVDAYIPESYISDEEARVEEYRRLMVAGRSGTLDEFEGELEDRFGDLPGPVQNLLKLEDLRVKAACAGIQLVSWRDGELQLKFERASTVPLEIVESVAEREKICGEKDIYLDRQTGTLYLKLVSREPEESGALLLMWLKLIIDDIIDSKCEQKKQ